MAQQDEKKSLELADDKIQEIQQKLAGVSKNKTAEERALFERINNAIQDDKSSLTAATEASGNIDLSPTKTAVPNNVVIKNLRTFQGDVAEAIKNQNASVLTVTLAEKRRRDETSEKVQVKQAGSVEVKNSPLPHHENRANIIMAIVSIVLVLLGVGAIAGFYILQKNAPPVATISTNKAALIGYSQIAELDTEGASRQAFTTLVTKEKNESVLASQEIRYLSVVKSVGENTIPISTQELMSLLAVKAPASLIRSFGPRFMLGIYKDQSNELFLLIELESFENAFSGMLQWEDVMNDDLGTIFSKRTLPLVERDPVTLATTSSTVSNFDTFTNQEFEDETIRNKDARILRNSRGETVFLYSFLDQQTLLITSNERALSEIMSKLIAERLVR